MCERKSRPNMFYFKNGDIVLLHTLSKGPFKNSIDYKNTALNN